MAVISTPALQKSSMLTQAELLRRTDAAGNIIDIAEVLDETNDILHDVVFKEGNLPVGDKQSIRTGMPDVYWRQMNRGVPSSKTSVATVTETCAEMAARSMIDAKIMELNGNGASYRKTEERPFIEQMGQKFAHELFYGDVKKSNEGFAGLATRYSTTDTKKADNAKNVIDCGGTGDTLTSIYIVGWNEQSVYCPYPKGSPVGLQAKDRGEILVPDDLGNMFSAYVMDYSWNVGLMIRDWRYVVRLANINPEDLLTGTGIGSGDIKTAGTTNLLLKLQYAFTKIPRNSSIRLAMYMNTDVYAGMQAVEARTNADVIKYSERSDNYDYSKDGSFRGVPIRICDQIVNNEKAVA